MLLCRRACCRWIAEGLAHQVVALGPGRNPRVNLLTRHTADARATGSHRV